MNLRRAWFLPLLAAVLASHVASAAPGDCAAYLRQAKKLNAEVQSAIRKALEEKLDVGGASCRFRSEEWSIREEKHQAWCGGKDAAAIEQRLVRMSAELKTCGSDLSAKRQTAAAGARQTPTPGSTTGATTPAAPVTATPPPAVTPPSLPQAGSCFDDEPGFDRNEVKRPLAENMPALLADATYRIFNCARLSDSTLADVFAAISLHIARRKPPVACFDGDAGVLHGTWEGHRAWALQRGRPVAEDNIGWKTNSALACRTLAQADKKLLYADIMEVLAQADRGGVQRVPDAGRATLPEGSVALPAQPPPAPVAAPPAADIITLPPRVAAPRERRLHFD